ncbi:MAG: 23S rRNA (adenine(2503)-C(2))-methyltransferase RlmN [Proteobacteria bacterium]|nr:23S rRNA (adenine(2503)-C(2))-methyltransferase RlmN [Pseudomonadota bacterium]
MDIFTLTFHELSEQLGSVYGKGPFHAKVLMREILKSGNVNWHNAPEFRQSQKLTRQLTMDLEIPIPEVSRCVSENSTIKFLCRFKDSLESESVIIPMQRHNTLCISSQIGCKMGCRFCETGNMGFKRHLSASEIVGQVFAARFILKKEIRNLVFMGMGEPFDNFEQVRQAIEVLSDQRGFDFAHRRITVSTAGLIEGITRLGKLNWPRINLALSLNAPNDEIRSYLMPVNKRYPMAELKKALISYPLRKKGLFLIEYVLINGLNDSETHARELAEFLAPLPVRLNLIPLNKTHGFPHDHTHDKDVHRFAAFLEDKGIYVIKRWSKGSSLSAGCGQLGSGASLNLP